LHQICETFIMLKLNQIFIKIVLIITVLKDVRF